MMTQLSTASVSGEHQPAVRTADFGHDALTVELDVVGAVDGGVPSYDTSSEAAWVAVSESAGAHFDHGLSQPVARRRANRRL